MEWVVPGGFLILLDDVASMMGKVAAAAGDDIASAAKLATSNMDGAASMAQMGVQKASAVVMDDIPVNAKAVAGQAIEARRELAVVARIAKGSFINKVWIVPAAVAINALVPVLLTPILVLGGAYLAYEGTEKLLGHGGDADRKSDTNFDGKETAKEFEDQLVAGAIKTDIVMSMEITFIALGAFYPDASWINQFVSLAMVGVVTTIGIYGIVAGLVKLDDVGLHLAERKGTRLRHRNMRLIGRIILVSAPKLMRGISVIGTGAMLYIGGELIAHGIPPLEHLFHAIREGIESSLSGWVGVVLGILAKMGSEGVAGVFFGLIIVGAMKLYRFLICQIKSAAEKTEEKASGAGSSSSVKRR